MFAIEAGGGGAIEGGRGDKVKQHSKAQREIDGEEASAANSAPKDEQQVQQQQTQQPIVS